MLKHISSILIFLFVSGQLLGQCSLRDMTVTPSDCIENSFTVEVNFLFSEVSDSFNIRGNGTNYGTFAYSELPIVLGPLPGNCETLYEFVARDKQSEGCSTFVDLGKICCNPPECSIEIKDFSSGRCSEEGMIIQFDLDTQGVAGLGFDVFSGDDFIGFYKYNQLPITLDNFTSTGTATETLIVCENDNPNCCDTLVFESTCGCGIFDIDVDVVECDNSEETFYARIDFIPQMTSDSFFVGGNNTTYGTYAYNDLPILIGPLSFSETIQYEFLILDRSSAVCFNFYDLGIVNGCSTIPCDIDDISVAVEDCTPNGVFYANISFDHNGMVSDSFVIRGNGNAYGTFEYGQESYRIGPIEGDCERILEFGVVDQGNESCQSFVILEDPVCCIMPCRIYEVRADLDVCMIDGTFFIDILFNYEGMVSDSFDIKGNGNNYGTFEYGRDSYRIGPLEGNCETIYEFVVIDKENQDCQSFVALEEPVCCELPCPLNDIGAEANCDEGVLIIEVGTNDSGDADEVLLYFNGEFEAEVGYNMFPYIITLTDDIPFPLLIEAVDPINEFCVVETELENGCERVCEIGNLNIDFIECDNENRLYFKLNFEHNQESLGTFEVLIDEETQGFYNYSELPIDLGPINNTGEHLNFTVSDSTSSECLRKGIVESITCTSSIDELKELGVQVIAANGYIMINNDDLLPLELHIYSLLGQSLYQGSLGNGVELTTTEWLPGIYIARIRIKKQIYTVKIYVQ